MIKRFIVICITIISSAAFAQQGTGSPYSFYGIGSLMAKGTVENRSMGGMGVYLDSIHVNLRNPAAYAGNSVKSMPFNGESRPVKFTVAGTMTNSTLKSNTAEDDANTAIFDYIAISMPIGKFGFGFGLMPFTSVGYKLDDYNNDEVFVNRFEGEGGVNKVFAGLGYQVNEKLSVGVDFSYNFGNIQNTGLEVAYEPDGSVVQYQTSEFNRSDLSGLNLNFGVAYKTYITEELEWSATATYAPESQLTSRNVRSFSTVTIDGETYDITGVSSTIDADLEAQGLDKTELDLPSTLTFGTGIGNPKSWFVGAEYTFQNTSKFSNPVFSNQNTSFEDASKIAVGGFYIPNYNTFSGYFKRVVYRAGFNMAKTGLVIKDESIKEFGISFGLGLPVGNRNLFSNANLGVEFGQRGTTNQNLIKENFVNFNLSLSLNARWFEQRKYN
ncbi:outer membrane protein transport protein [Winogradskyella arenosi]|uniref:Long-subunit fatty acid transport protein n=1 Tax=Winogradskyella arenosi TaxID=533325 RepID=A0A368ZFC0_9FLAO|nr:outer membrane protein transport protein [Winogradskyella arenosi]RCW90325.1 long-subunit fatty acid transport protein [Winogradskyella arenosi]